MNKIMVSIICLCYNHEPYIRKCLDSLISQKTDYNYEIIVHDDCSTDNSKSIIEEYVKKYPDIIKPIFQIENQYSKKLNKGIVRSFIYPVVSQETKYIALCECDDYWCDELKLQKQVTALEENPNCSLCLAKVLKVTDNDKSMNEYLPSTNIKTGIIKSKDFIKMVCCENYAFQTSSYMYPIKYYRQLDSAPEFISICNIGDIVKQLFYGDKGDVYYIDEVMSCYRLFSKGSWSSRTMHNKKAYLEHQKNMIETMAEFNRYSSGKYKEYCEYHISKRKWRIALTNEDYKEMVKKEYRAFFNELNFKTRLFAFLSAYCPWLIKIVKKIKHSRKLV